LKIGILSFILYNFGGAVVIGSYSSELQCKHEQFCAKLVEVARNMKLDGNTKHLYGCPLNYTAEKAIMPKSGTSIENNFCQPSIFQGKKWGR